MPLAELAAYFSAERQGGWLLLGLGGASLGFAVFLWSTRSSFLAMAWPLVVLGSMELILGATIALRTPAQVAALEQGLRTSRAPTVSAETQRMATINRNFRVIKGVETAVIVLGLLLALLLPPTSAWSAVGLGLLLHAAVLWVFDAFAQQRAEVYARWLQGLTP